MKLFPRDVKFFEYFSQESALVEMAAAALCELFKNNENVEEKCNSINRFENECNNLVRKINRELYQTFRTPLDREDIYEITRRLEDVMNLIKSISVRIGLFNLPSLTHPSAEIMNTFHSMIRGIKVVIDDLEKLPDISENVRQIEHMKTQSETLLRLAYAELYERSHETPADVLYTLQWSLIYELIQRTLETTERLTTVIEGIALKLS